MRAMEKRVVDLERGTIDPPIIYTIRAPVGLSTADAMAELGIVAREQDLVVFVTVISDPDAPVELVGVGPIGGPMQPGRKAAILDGAMQ